MVLRQLVASVLLTTRVGEPDAGNLHVRFDEGERFQSPLPTRLIFETFVNCRRP